MTNTQFNTTEAGAKDIFFAFTFHFRPSVELAIVATAFFALASLVVLWTTLANSHRPRYVWITFVCAVLEAGGYGARIYAAQQAQLTSFIVQIVVILVVPIALALVNYTVVGLLIKASGKQIGCLPPQRVAKAFFISDIACFLLQSGGAGMMMQASLQQLGKTCVIAGILLQLGFFTAFCVLAHLVAFGASFRLYEIPHLKPVFHALFATSALLYIRSVYRVVEYLDVEGYTGTHEWLFGLFETLTILLCFAAYARWHFGRLLPYGEAELAELVATRRESQPAPCATDSPANTVKPFPDIVYTSSTHAKAAELPPTLP